jgi:hypothetical protein
LKSPTKKPNSGVNPPFNGPKEDETEKSNKLLSDISASPMGNVGKVAVKLKFIVSVHVAGSQPESPTVTIVPEP